MLPVLYRATRTKHPLAMFNIQSSKHFLNGLPACPSCALEKERKEEHDGTICQDCGVQLANVLRWLGKALRGLAKLEKHPHDSLAGAKRLLGQFLENTPGATANDALKAWTATLWRLSLQAKRAANNTLQAECKHGHRPVKVGNLDVLLRLNRAEQKLADAELARFERVMKALPTVIIEWNCRQRIHSMRDFLGLFAQYREGKEVALMLKKWFATHPEPFDHNQPVA